MAVQGGLLGGDLDRPGEERQFRSVHRSRHGPGAVRQPPHTWGAVSPGQRLGQGRRAVQAGVAGVFQGAGTDRPRHVEGQGVHPLRVAGGRGTVLGQRVEQPAQRRRVGRVHVVGRPVLCGRRRRPGAPVPPATPPPRKGASAVRGVFSEATTTTADARPDRAVASATAARRSRTQCGWCSQSSRGSRRGAVAGASRGSSGSRSKSYSASAKDGGGKSQGAGAGPPASRRVVRRPVLGEVAGRATGGGDRRGVRVRGTGWHRSRGHRAQPVHGRGGVRAGCRGPPAACRPAGLQVAQHEPVGARAASEVVGDPGGVGGEGPALVLDSIRHAGTAPVAGGPGAVSGSTTTWALVPPMPKLLTAATRRPARRARARPRSGCRTASDRGRAPG